MCSELRGQLSQQWSKWNYYHILDPGSFNLDLDWKMLWIENGQLISHFQLYTRPMAQVLADADGPHF